MPTTGEKPGIGVYICNRCRETVRLLNSGDRLLPCPKCGYSKFTRISWLLKTGGRHSHHIKLPS